MSYGFSGTKSLYEDIPTLAGINTPEDEQRQKEMNAVKNQAMDGMLWAASQNMALGKVKLYHTLAKEIYSQQ